MQPCEVLRLMFSGLGVPWIPTLLREVPIHTLPTGLLGPGGSMALGFDLSQSQNSFGWKLKVGLWFTPVTSYTPMGSGSFSLPRVEG